MSMCLLGQMPFCLPVTVLRNSSTSQDCSSRKSESPLLHPNQVPQNSIFLPFHKKKSFSFLRRDPVRLCGSTLVSTEPHSLALSLRSALGCCSPVCPSQGHSGRNGQVTVVPVFCDTHWQSHFSLSTGQRHEALKAKVQKTSR